ncbi:hypothetical protein ACP70R_004159 [Stipagrostis hirtigluma subsp. patula]
MWPNPNEIRGHLIKRGFVKDYTVWSFHGESGGTTSADPIGDGPTDDVTNDGPHGAFGDYVDGVDVDDDDGFDLEAMLRHAEPESARELLYDESKGCDKEYTVSRSVLELLKLKASHNWSDRSFDDLLVLLAAMLPKPSLLPANTYQAKKLICPLSLGVEKIHACLNHCIIYRKEYASLVHCPTCGASRCKRNRNSDETNKSAAGEAITDHGCSSTTTSEGPKKKIPAMVMWYLPMIDRLRRLFSNPRDSKLLRWHVDKRKKGDNMIRHPADAREWKNFDALYPQFVEDPRNIRFALSTDGMNPFGDLSSQHSTWPVILTMYNLPPWLCHKRKYLMLAILIQGPKQPGNDIDVFLEPLLEDMATLWNDGVRMWDEFRREYFNARAIIFVTINDLPALYSLSGQIKGKTGCVVCLDKTAHMYLTHSTKTVYMRHRRFLRRDHRYCTTKASFDATAERDFGLETRSGKHVFEMVKKIKVVLGKKVGKGKKRKKTATSEDEGHAHLFKKSSIFFKYLPYWADLQVRHAIDDMHLEKNVFDSVIGTVMDTSSKPKDSLKSRKDLVHMGIWKELHPEERPNGKQYLPAAGYTLTLDEKKAILKCFRRVKVPTGFSSNISRLVRMADMSLAGYNSHDCHVMLTVFLAIAIRAIQPAHIKVVITKLCYFFNRISEKAIDREQLVRLQPFLIETL